jgi:ABC-type branched-subunit amino acid transport system permease subunit
MTPDFNLPFVLSVVGAFLASAVVAFIYVWPAVRAMPRYEALRLLAAFHAFRFLGMNFLVSGFVSSELNSDFANKVGWGDLIAAILAPLSMAALSRRWSIAVPIVWIFNIWGTLDLLIAYYMGVTQIGNPGLFGAGIYIPALYVPLLLVSHILAFMLLTTNRGAEKTV